MSSQSGNGNLTTGNTGCGGSSNNANSQTASASINSSKSNTKMSIDHQATLDKGLKMKIKRTKPGTKSSEAKHEIVKAEQQQNGLTATVAGNSIPDEIPIGTSASNAPSPQNIVHVASSSTATATVTSSAKKLVVSNTPLNSNTTSNTAGTNPTPTISNTTQSSSLSTKRGSSGHRREKAKEKSLHSSRTGIDNKITPSSEKEPQDKSVCQCSESVNLLCSSSTCTRLKDTSITQRLSNSNIHTSTIPPGIFIPSTDSHVTPATSASELEVSANVVTSQVIPHSLSSGSANAPGPPNKEASNNSNVKISAHIAAQLAAVATNFTSVDSKMYSINVSPHNKNNAPGAISAAINHTISVPTSNMKASIMCSSATTQLGNNMPTTSSQTDECLHSPPLKRAKHNDCKISETSKLNNKDMVDICVGTSVGTITEPDCLGPCEPGTSVTLEGIVWHETEGGVLVVNVTWRGKTYVGTLLDCTRHDWAPPRFCDSPTDELDSRTPKGRGKRGRAVITPDLSNFTETRSSLRNGTTKGGRNSRGSSTPAIEKTNCATSISSGNGGSTPSTSPTAFLPSRTEKRKSKDETPSPSNIENDVPYMINASGIPISSNSVGDVALQPQSLINPVTGLNVQISSKKCKTAPHSAISPILIECPQQDCRKKYKHTNGLRYHQSHAHGNASLLDEDVTADTDETLLTPVPSPIPLTPTTGESKLVVNKTSVLQLIEDPESGSKISDSNTTCLPLDAPITSLESEKQSKICEISEDTLITKTTTAVSQFSSDAAKNGDKVNNKTSLPILPEEQNIFNTAEQTPSVITERLCFEQQDSTSQNENVSTVSDHQQLTLTSCDIKMTHRDFKIDCNNANNDMSSEIETNEANSNAHNKTLISPQSGSKIKKLRKSPLLEANIEEYNTCSLSRDGVQSPAYSDISDDSTSAADHQLLEKQHSKNTETSKKSIDVGTTGTACTSSGQHLGSSPIGGYGVYQFYQQQQFSVPSSIEGQHLSKVNIPQPINPTPGTEQNIPLLSEYNKKEPILDLMTKSVNQSSTLLSQESKKDLSQQSPPSIASSHVANIIATNSQTSKSASQFYSFNYMSPSYAFNVEQNYLPVQISTDDDKSSRHASALTPTNQQELQSPNKDDRGKEVISPSDPGKYLQQQILPNKVIKPEPLPKSENMKFDVNNSTLSQVPHIPVHSKDLQAMGVYPSMYQRHPMALSSQHLTREEELRRYYIFSDQQRRQNSGLQSINLANPPTQGSSLQSSMHHARDDCQHDVPHGQNHCQQNSKIKLNTPLPTAGNTGKIPVHSKESPKTKQEEETKPVKQEGQKPTMETQGPPPPPTSQYFLHPSYIASAPFGFDPNHPMYRNVIMPASSPYNSSPYHLSLPRFHAPEDLSRNPGTKALDALHHAASQYYTTHKIHELSERALKSPNSAHVNTSNTIKVSVSSPTVVSHPHSILNSNQIGHHAATNQPTISTHNLPSQSISNAKPEVTAQRTHGSGSVVHSVNSSESQKTTSNNSPIVTNIVGVNINSGGGNSNGGGTTDSRSPPPQRHVHTHHHTHVGLGYPMYPAPYGAAVLASQQAAAVAVINPFPPGPTK